MIENKPARLSSPSRRRASGVGFSLLGLLVVCLLANWWVLAHDDPVVTIPTSALPNPNAYDFYVAAGRAMVDGKPIAYTTMKSPVIGPRTPDEEQELQKVEAVLQRNAGAIQRLHEGFAYDYRSPPTQPFSLSTEFAGFRTMARLLFMQSRVKAARGDWNGATNSALDGIRLGEDVQRGGAFIAHLTGAACQSIGQRPIWETAAHLDAAQARGAARRLRAIMDRHFSYADTIQEEKWTGQAARKWTFRFVTLRSAFATREGFVKTGASFGQRIDTGLQMLYGKKRMMNDYITYMDQVSRQSGRAYGLHLPPPLPPSDPINEAALSVFSDGRIKDVEVETQNGLLLLTLILHAYRLEHGHYPATLAELAPTYLKQLPDDPFAAQGTFRYRLRANRYVLYSVGPDGVDDCGIPVNDPKYVGGPAPRPRYRITPATRGDIVAGINFP